MATKQEPSRPFGLEVKEIDAACQVIEVSGELDLAVAEPFKLVLAASTPFPKVIVNLSACEFIDSAGIAVIVMTHREFTGAGRNLILCEARSQVERLLALTGLAEDQFLVATLEEALAGEG